MEIRHKEQNDQCQCEHTSECCGHEAEHNHNHDRGDTGCTSSGCHCGENLAVKSDEKEENDLPKILTGTGIFAAGIIASHFFSQEIAGIVLYIIAYLILGSEILLKSVKNILKGEVFDENFLMSIATLGAFVIGEYPEAVGVMLFYRVGEWFEDRAVEKSRSQILDAIDMRPETVNIVVEGNIEVIPAAQAQIGQLMQVRPGERIPLDGIVAAGESRIDTSPVTGEPVPVSVAKGQKVLSGCVNTSGLLQIEITNTLETSLVTKIMDAVENAASHKPVMEKFITRFARVYTPFVVFLALATAIIPSLITGEWYYWIYTALTFLVISCPCALVLSVPLAFFSAIGAGSKLGLLFKGGSVIEALGKVKAVVMDKTGTITKGNFVVQSCLPAANLTTEQLLQNCAQAELNSTHPIAVSIVSAAREKELILTAPSEVSETAGKGICAKIDNQEILCGNISLLKENGIDITDINIEEKNKYGTAVHVAISGIYAGKLIISDTIKEDAGSTMAYLKKRGLKTVMLTGDARENADYVGKELGIDMVYAKLLPEEKLERLNQVRKEHGNVLFVGDGINDAPVLAGSDVGAAMGSGADAAVEAADMVFMNSNLTAIAQAINLAGKTSKIALQNVIIALTIKIIIMILGLLGFANMWWAVFADTGVAVICILNSIRLLYHKK